MNKNRDVIRQIIIIAVIGLAITFFRGENSWSFTLGAEEGADFETVLDTLNLALPFLAMVLGLGVIVYLRIRRGSEDRSIWDEDEE